jgi:hypothetical protein
VKTQDGQTQDAKLEARPLDEVRDLVRGWAEEARRYAELRAELEVWLMKRQGLTADLTLSDGETAAEILLLECELVDRVTQMLKKEEEP